MIYLDLYNDFTNRYDNKLLFTIINDTTIKINDKLYEINNTYDLPLYVIDNIKNQYFPKIIIKFN